MRWNRLITTGCIFLLEMSKIFVAVISGFMVIIILIGRVESPVVVSLGEDYRLETMNNLETSISGFYKGNEFKEISVTPLTYSFTLPQEEMPFYLAMLPSIFVGLAVFLFIHLLVKLLKSIEERDFFSNANVKRLRYMSLILMVGEVASWMYRRLLSIFINNSFEIEGMFKVGRGFSFSLDSIFSYFFLGLMILLIANAFEHGLKLKEEQELTI